MTMIKERAKRAVLSGQERRNASVGIWRRPPCRFIPESWISSAGAPALLRFRAKPPFGRLRAISLPFSATSCATWPRARMSPTRRGCCGASPRAGAAVANDCGCTEHRAPRAPPQREGTQQGRGRFPPLHLQGGRSKSPRCLFGSLAWPPRESPRPPCASLSSRSRAPGLRGAFPSQFLPSPPRQAGKTAGGPGGGGTWGELSPTQPLARCRAPGKRETGGGEKAGLMNQEREMVMMMMMMITITEDMQSK